MYTWAENSFKTIEEYRIFVEVFTECRAGFFGVY